MATTSLGLIVLKMGTKNGAPISVIENKIHFNINLITISGIFLYGVSFLLYLWLISKNDLGYIIPLTTALVYGVIFFASSFIFHEVFNATKIIGIIMILAGVILLNVKT